jgi:hypothetical protein
MVVSRALVAVPPHSYDGQTPLESTAAAEESDELLKFVGRRRRAG